LGAEEWVDTDADGLPDWIEIMGITDPAGDNDSDFVTNLEEFNHGLNATGNDSDGDGLSDGNELYADSTHGDTDGFATNPLSPDTDGDGMSDGWESSNGFNPTVLGGTGDADSDGLTDLQEYVSGTNPHASDTDGDTMPDYYEVAKGIDPTRNDATEDPDRDGLTNIQEYNLGTHPKNFDTDGDLLSDGWEFTCGLNPLVANSSTTDTDGDGLTDFQEMVYGTNPTLADTDGDGASDGQEVNQGSFPNDPSDNGQPPSEEEKLTVKTIVGDPSGSHSERWSVAVKDLTTGNTILNHQSPAFGELSEDASSTFNQFRKGHSYELSLIHVGTDPQKFQEDPEGEFYPDYDWALEVSVKGPDNEFADVKNGGSTENPFVVLDPWDPQSQSVASTVQLLVNRAELSYPWEGWEDRTQHYQDEIASKRVLLVPIEVTKIWSDQFSGSDANQLPNKPSPSHVGSGAEKHKYILVGGRDPGQQVYIKAEVEFPDIPYFKSKFKFALARMSGDIPFIKGPSATIDENGELSLQTSQIDAVSYSNDEPEDYAIVGGYDADGNGLANSEVGYISKYRIRPVSFSAHDGNRTWLSAFVIGGWINDRPFSAAFLQAFLTGSTMSGVGGTVGDETMSINDEDEPDHHVGIAFDASNSGPIRRYSWSRYSMLAYVVAGDQGITGMIGVRLASAAIKSEVQSYAWQPNETEKTFSWTLHATQNDVLISFANWDLHTSFGSAWLKNAHMKVTIDKNTLTATSVVVEGTLTDLYDWNYGEGYETDRRAATVQAGYNTLSPGGWIFRLQVDLDTPITLPSPAYNFN